MAVLIIIIRTALLAIILWLPLSVSAREPLELYEQKIKAGLLYNFLKYTEWPENHVEEMKVCLFGEDVLEAELQPMAERTVQQRPITLKNATTIEEVKDCQLVYVGKKGRRSWPALRQALRGQSILTVSDIQGFNEAGGMVVFGRKDDRIHVEINLDAVEKAHLRVGERLLKLASISPPATH